jgi:membrane protease YdiL (CAAX protease family)
LLFALALIALYVALQGLTGLVLYRAELSARGSTLLVMELIICAVMVVAYRVLVRVVERRGARELAFDASTAWALRGVLTGAALFCAVYAVLWASGSARYLGFDGLSGVTFAFGISIAAAFGEEIIVRGGVFRVIEEGFGTFAAVIFSAALFGALHAVNDGATVVSTVSIALEAGVLLGLAYTAARSLWFPIGIHFGWNFTEGGIFGATVSGFKMPGVLNFPLSGPDILTGGAFGPEASVVAVIVCLAGSALVARSAIRSHRWRKRA